jgi:hypothetical protein
LTRDQTRGIREESERSVNGAREERSYMMATQPDIRAQTTTLAEVAALGDRELTGFMLRHGFVARLELRGGGEAAEAYLRPDGRLEYYQGSASLVRRYARAAQRARQH